MSRPTDHLDWVTSDDPALIVEPADVKKDAGWLPREQPPSQYFNWIQRTIDKWLKLFDMASYDVVVGAGIGCTHATLAAAIADVGLGTNLRVLLRDSFNIATTIVLNKAGWRIEAAPGVVITEAGAATGLSLAADRIDLVYLRFAGYTTSGDKAVACTVDGQYCRVLFCEFGSADTEVDDSAVVASGAKPLVVGSR